MNYTTKYNRADKNDVYVFINKKVVKTKIIKTRITDQEDYKTTGVNGSVLTLSGLKIEYLVGLEIQAFGESGTIQSMDWYDEKDVYETREELIANIE